MNERAYRLVWARDRVDSDTFERGRGGPGTRPGPRRVSELERAAALWHGEPLPEDRYADWSQQWRDALTDRHREVLAALADAHAEPVSTVPRCARRGGCWPRTRSTRARTGA